MPLTCQVVLGVANTAQFNSWDKPELVAGMAEEIAAVLPASRWVWQSAGVGTKGDHGYTIGPIWNWPI
jgi:hypothetical protein